ncbi:MAG: hypothetical protein LC791_00595 [Acidobacteria bacterium]|nr:hypothetical protein [Acidobacteriota bacterium]
MTTRLFGAVGAVAMAMALESAPFGLTEPRSTPVGDAAKGPSPTVVPAPALVGVAPPSLALESTQPSMTTLSMVPKDAKVVARLRRMLPKELSVQQAAVGFRNQAQFIATVQVSENLGVPFLLLKSKVVGEGLSLGQAIQQLKPDANVSRELSRARERSTR